MFSLLLLSSFSFSSSSLPLTVIQVTIRFISDQSTLGLFLPAFWVISTSMQAPLPTPSPHGFLNLLISTDLQPPLHLSTYNQFQSTLTTTLPQLGLSDCGQKQPPRVSAFISSFLWCTCPWTSLWPLALWCLWPPPMDFLLGLQLSPSLTSFHTSLDPMTNHLNSHTSTLNSLVSRRHPSFLLPHISTSPFTSLSPKRWSAEGENLRNCSDHILLHSRHSHGTLASRHHTNSKFI